LEKSKRAHREEHRCRQTGTFPTNEVRDGNDYQGGAREGGVKGAGEDASQAIDASEIACCRASASNNALFHARSDVMNKQGNHKASSKQPSHERQDGPTAESPSQHDSEPKTHEEKNGLPQTRNADC